MPQNDGFRLAAALTLAGAVSGLVTIFLLNTTRGGLLLGVVFGAIIAICLALSGAIGTWGAVQFTTVAIFTYFLSYLASFCAQLALGSFGLLSEREEWSMGNPGSPSAIALLAGGLVGGFLVIGDVLLLVGPGIGKAKTLAKTLLWSAVSGALALTGWALAPSLGTALWHLVRSLHLDGPSVNAQGDVRDMGPAPLVYSVHLVWQTGMAFVIGFIVRRYAPVPEPKGLQP